MYGKIAVDRSLREQMYSDKKHTEMKTVQEICKLTGVTRKTLYYYDKIDLLKPVCRTGKQRSKRYSDEAVDQLMEIRIYKEAGLTLEEIRGVLGHSVEEQCMTLNMAYQRLSEKKKDVEGQMDHLRKMIIKKEQELQLNKGGEGK